MVSKYEILEFLRKRGGKVKLLDLLEILGLITGTSKTAYQTIKILWQQRYIKKYWRIVKPSGNLLLPPKVIWVEVKGKKPRREQWIELTDYAYETLRRHKVKSFFELPMAKLFKTIHLKRDWAKI